MANSSQVGERVDIVAPGSEILSPINTSTSSYDSWNGTSMAAPHVSGVAGMIWSVNPTLTGAEVKEILTSTTVGTVSIDIDGDGVYGVASKHEVYNILNAKNAVNEALRRIKSKTDLKTYLYGTISETNGAISNGKILFINKDNRTKHKRAIINEHGFYEIELETGLYDIIVLKKDSELMLKESTIKIDTYIETILEKNIEIEISNSKIKIINKYNYEKAINFENPIIPYENNDKIYLPIRKIGEAANYEVGWDGETQTASFTKTLATDLIERVEIILGASYYTVFHNDKISEKIYFYNSDDLPTLKTELGTIYLELENLLDALGLFINEHEFADITEFTIRTKVLN